MGKSVADACLGGSLGNAEEAGHGPIGMSAVVCKRYRLALCIAEFGEGARDPTTVELVDHCLDDLVVLGADGSGLALLASSTGLL